MYNVSRIFRAYSTIGIFIALGLVVVVPAAAEYRSAEDIYIEALELILEDRTSAAIEKFDLLQEQHPESEYAKRAERWITDFSMRRDTSGLVGFYIGNLITGTYITIGLPLVFDMGPVATGASGLAGVGGSLYLSHLITRDRDLSLGTQLATNSIQTTSFMSYIWSYRLLQKLGINTMDNELDDRIFWMGSMATAVGSRIMGYRWSQDKDLPAGKPALYLTTYAWSNLYLSLAMFGVLSMDMSIVSDALYLTIPTAAAIGAAYHWDKLGWSATRTGMLSIGGAGGMLVGGFVNLILSPLDLPSEFVASSLIAFSALGQFTAARGTRNFEPDPMWDRNRTAMQILPTARITESGLQPGIMLEFQY